jgi:YD repeat-containing protein
MNFIVRSFGCLDTQECRTEKRVPTRVRGAVRLWSAVTSLVRSVVSKSGGVAVISLLIARMVFAQGDPIADANGFQKNHDYFSAEPFEHIDTYTGSLVLTFTDLVLSGNAGHDLRFTRTYNSKAFTNGGNFWTFGIEGLVMNTDGRAWPPPMLPCPDDPSCPSTLYTADGAAHVAVFPLSTDNPYTVVGTNQFWRFDRQSCTLMMPDGTVSQFDTQGKLISSADAFGNTVTLTRNGTTLIVQQTLSITDPLQCDDSKCRTVVIALQRDAYGNPVAVNGGYQASSMTYLGRTWQYSLQSAPQQALPPAGTGPGWSYAGGGTGDNPELLVTTPHGGQVRYVFQLLQFPAAVGVGNLVFTMVLTDRYTYDRGGTELGHRHYAYDFPGGYGGSEQTTITAYNSQGAVTSVTTIQNGSNPDCSPALFDSYLVGTRTVQQSVGQPAIESESRCYEGVPKRVRNR